MSLHKPSDQKKKYLHVCTFIINHLKYIIEIGNNARYLAKGIIGEHAFF